MVLYGIERGFVGPPIRAVAVGRHPQGGSEPSPGTGIAEQVLEILLEG